MDDRLDGGIEPAPKPRTRRAQRMALDAEVILRRAGENNYRVHVYDISPEGCKVEFVQRPNLDEMVWVKFEGLEAMGASVCWTRGPVAGLEFARPIHPAVFDMLVQRLAAAPR